MASSPPPLPLIPTELLKRFHADEPTDTRFRAAARLRQSLWREAQGYPCGRHVNARGRSRKLGSRLTDEVARTGVNIIDPGLVPLARREVAYREIGAVIDTDRLWGNLLASQPLTFSLFGPLKQDLRLATAVFRRLAPGLVGEVVDVLFEHSPGRGHPGLTGDHTAFDVLVRCTTPQGRSAFIGIEMKYSEAPAGSMAPARPRYVELSRSAGVYRDPDSADLRAGSIEQLWREQLLVTAMIETGLYEEGRLLIIAPALNNDCQAAIRRYETALVAADPAQTRFQAVTLDTVLAVLAEAGADRIAGRLTERYLDFGPVHAAVAETFEVKPAAPASSSRTGSAAPEPRSDRFVAQPGDIVLVKLDTNGSDTPETTGKGSGGAPKGRSHRRKSPRSE